MRSRRVLTSALLLAFLTLAFLYSAPKASGEEDLWVRVRITPTAPLEFQTDANIHLDYQSASDWKPLDGVLLGKGRSWRIDWEKGTARILLSSDGGDKIASVHPLRLTPDTDGQYFRVGSREYTGILELYPGKNGIDIYNLVDLETYVAGVMAGESIPGWHPEALKAQAVAGRTYALRQRGRHKSFDFCDQPHCQRYLGRTQTQAFIEAVQATKGEVIVYDEKLIWAFYHSNSGGQTENNEDIWGGEALPYLRSVAGNDQSANRASWPNGYLLTMEQLLARLQLTGWQSCEILPMNAKNGKPVAYTFRCPEDGKSVTWTREELRWKLGFPSPRFTIRRVTGEAIRRAIAGQNGGAYRIEKSVAEGDRIRLTLQLDVQIAGEAIDAPVTLRPSEILFINGVGYGHGVGLSQWGSQTMALSGKNYRDILHHYYGDRVAIVPYKPEYQVK
jgi:stage II sporulation protein D